MEDNKYLTQEELNLFYYEKMIEKTYLFTRRCNRWTDLSFEHINNSNFYFNFGYILFPNYYDQGLMLQLEDVVCLYLKDLLNLFTDPLNPTPEEFTLFNLEYGVDYIIKPNGEK